MKLSPITILCFIGMGVALYIGSTTDVVSYWRDRLFSGAGEVEKAKLVQVGAVPDTGKKQVPDESGQTVPASGREQDLNELGVQLILSHRPWQGMYWLAKEIERNPNRIAPMINMAVTLTDMGLSRPAGRYLEMARQIDPSHPLLKKNFPGSGRSATLEKPESAKDRELAVSGRKANLSELANEEIRMLWGVDLQDILDMY